MATPYARFHYETIASTQDEARRLLADDAPVVVSAARQTAGRGRHGRRWANAPQALAVSVGITPDWPSPAWPRLTLVAGLSAREVVGKGLGLKWPNDLMREGVKVGGILTEADAAGVVIGLGVNIFWPNPPDGYGSCFEARQPDDLVAGLAGAFAERLLERVAMGPAAWGRDEYRMACVTLGQSIRWEPGGAGTAVDVAADGSLLVETDTGVETITAGEVWEIRDGDPGTG